MQLKWFDKHSYFLVKLSVSILLVCVGFRLIFSQSPTGFSPPVKTHPEISVDLPENREHIPKNDSLTSVNPKQQEVDLGENRDQIQENGIVQVSEIADPPVSIHDFNGTQVSLDAKPPVSVDFLENKDEIPKKEKCDLFRGDWIPTSIGPVYTNESCRLIEGHQNCMTNGRPDTGYLYWRWNPRNCELPPFDAGQFLELMRNKTWALIGDSISRNHVQSLLCILSKVEQAVEVYHDEEYKSKRWSFPLHNFTISVLWSPFLAKAAIFEDYNGVSSADIELHIDKLDTTWTNQFRDLDYMMFSSGKWFVKTTVYYENNTILGCHNCQRNLTGVGFNFAYRRVLQSVFDFIISSNHKGIIFYRTSTPDHFEHGEWYNGGNCNRTAPIKEGEFEMNELNKILRAIELEEFEKAAVKASEKGVNLKLFDVMQLSLLRPDGHPDIYRHFHPFALDKSTKIISDCLHWCLPGPIDSWNDLIMEMVVNG